MMVIYTNKNDSCLLESEKMVLDLIRFNNFDKTKYKKVIEQESLNNKYIVIAEIFIVNNKRFSLYKIIND